MKQFGIEIILSIVGSSWSNDLWNIQVCNLQGTMGDKGEFHNFTNKSLRDFLWVTFGFAEVSPIHFYSVQASA